MHAHLIIGRNRNQTEKELDNLLSTLGAKKIIFDIKKIEDVRELNRILKVSLSEKTLFFCPDIEKATDEALNAFLKTLEEPGENVFFALSSQTLSKVLPTVSSRCRIINVKNDKNEKEITDEQKHRIIQFLEGNSGQKLLFFDKIKDREEAIEFIESLIFFLHEKKDFKNMEMLIKTLSRLNANGNVNLHLSNLAINFK